MSTNRTSRPSQSGTPDAEQLQTLRKPLAGDIPLSRYLDPMVREGELYEKLDNGAVHCYACAHNCTIKPGGRGICQVRYNLDGKLYVPWGYVSGVQSDPIEKKPFNHVLPGSDTLTFGMLGCDMHCPYCFTGDTVVITDRGPVRFDELFNSIGCVEERHDGQVAYPDGLRAIAASGSWRAVRHVFKHPYKGKLAVIKPYYLPELRCTADHRVYATDDPRRAPAPIQAKDLTRDHYLAVPRHYHIPEEQTIDVAEILSKHEVTYRVPWSLSLEQQEYIATATSRGVTSREIGNALGTSGSYIRHVRSKLARGVATDTRTTGYLVEEEKLRFPNEHRPGIPATVSLDEGMARLLGYYCAEGSVTSAPDRPNSHTLCLTFGPDEAEYAEDAQKLVTQYLGPQTRIVQRDTTLAVETDKASVALLLKFLAGGHSREKQVPLPILSAPAHMVRAFVDAFIAGDGHHYPNGKVTFSTVSLKLAYGVAWLVLRLGCFPSIYPMHTNGKGVILGRKINCAPVQYTVVWFEEATIERQLIETEDYTLIPLRDITLEDYEGDVYNMMVEEEHNYLANFFLVKNCQNWDISQAMRDSGSGRPPDQVTPEQMVQMALRNDAKSMTSSYNEPLITSEWSMAVFKEARAAGLTCNFVSNGNATRGVLEYIRPYVDGYKIDLKSMNDKNYRKLGTVLEHVLDGVRMVYELGFWLEIVTLVVPGFNDSDDELRDAARFIKSVSADIPWHVTAFHKDYHMVDPDNTDPRTLLRAAEIGYREGLHYVYAGNMPGHVDSYEHTRCPSCQEILIKRIGYVVLDYQITPEGTCPKCQTKIPGLWPKSKKEVYLGTSADLFFRVPRRVR